MKKKCKILSALYMAVLLGVLMPVSTMKAAEDVNEGNHAPVVEIRYQGQNLAQSMDGTIDYNLFIGNSDQRLSVSAGWGSNLKSLSYYLDRDGAAESKSEEQLSSLWQTAGLFFYQEVALKQDGKYVLYVKATAENGEETYIRTNGIVVDTVRPAITGIQEGGTYPPGTKFGVEDDNIDKVLVNEQEVFPSAEDGMYQVAANGTSCVVRVKDKAGHETTCSVTIAGEVGEPQDEIRVITESGTYSLKAGTAYRLGRGSWWLEGDSTVYSGGITFYVNEDGDYNFKTYEK